MRVCVKCGEEKPLTAFRSVEGIYRSHTCEPCIYLKRKCAPASVRLPGEPETKRCGRCDKDKPITTFNRNGANNSRQSTCRACHKTKARRDKGIVPKPPAQPRPCSCWSCVPKSWNVILATFGKWVRLHANPSYREQYIAAKAERKRIDFAQRYAKDPEYQRTRVKTYKHSNPGKVVRWQGKRALLAAQQSDTTLTRSVVRKLFHSSSRCPYCAHDYTRSTKTLDHIVPLSRGGVHGVSNVLVCCRSCNSRKGAREFNEWINLLEPTHKRSAIAAFQSVKRSHPSQLELAPCA